MNQKFSYDPKGVYRLMKGSSIAAEKNPTVDEVETFWNSLW